MTPPATVRTPEMRAILKDDTLIVVEASNDTDFDYLTELGYEIVKEKIYKTNKHVFIKRA